MRKIKCVIENNETFVSLFSLWKLKQKLCGRQQTLLEECPLLSDKVCSKEEIHITENNKLAETDFETTGFLNNFFSNIIQNLDISRYLDS